VTSPLRRSAAWLLLAVSGLALSIAWVLASPVGASPDEEAHIHYAWGTITGQTIRGEELLTLPGGRTATKVYVTQQLMQYPPPHCYAFDPQTPVNACTPIPADNKQLVPQAAYMSRYPPLFYVVEGVALRAGAEARGRCELACPRVRCLPPLAAFH
jgi:hypothetical protein